MGLLDQRRHRQATQHLPPQLHPRPTARPILRYTQLLLVQFEIILQILAYSLLELQVLSALIWVVKEENLRPRGL